MTFIFVSLDFSFLLDIAFTLLSLLSNLSFSVHLKKNVTLDLYTKTTVYHVCVRRLFPSKHTL